MQSVGMKLRWVDCAPGKTSAACSSWPSPAELVVRLLCNALPHASLLALGEAHSPSSDDVGSNGAAFIFYDRIVALRTQTRLMPFMLGRVMAHEMTHLLLPKEPHSEAGLMRGQWPTDDLDFINLRLSISKRSARFLRMEAYRRVLLARSAVIN